MQCPVCPDSTLAMSNREGIEIDYCPKCRGVWLDRGELDKIIERSATATAPAAASGYGVQPRSDDDRDWDDRQRYRDEHYHKRRKKGFLGDLFDFD